MFKTNVEEYLTIHDKKFLLSLEFCLFEIIIYFCKTKTIHMMKSFLLVLSFRLFEIINYLS